MKRKFNITGFCNPQRHYMVKIDNRVKKIKADYVDYGSYFVINRGRQYGKTTTLRALEEYLKEEYIVLSLDFQEIETASFADSIVFSHTFAKKLLMAFRFVEAEDRENLQELLINFKKEVFIMEELEQNIDENLFIINNIKYKKANEINILKNINKI